ncbi:MAG TPA: YfhO family protein [Gemmatimonadaceae bacterium]|jgi:hypothetical protein|nr:YfhO family protein [Gemmatimonadaceae bacterium]
MAKARTPETNKPSDLATPAHPRSVAALVYAVSTLLLTYPALAGKILLNPISDQFKAGYAFREFAARSLREGRGFPLWNPFVEGGLPYIGAMHGDVFYPTFLLRWLMPTDLAMTWEFPIHVFLCGLFTYLFLRAWGFSFWAALLGGLAYMLGGSIAGYAYAGHDGKLFVSTMLPASLLLVTRGVRDGLLWSWGALAVVIGLAVLSPHPQLLQYMLLTSGAFALYVAFADHGSGALPRDVALKRLGLAAVAVGVGMLIGAIQFMPVFEYKPWSPRAPGHDWITATSYSYPIEETLNWFWPQFSGILQQYWGRNGIHFHSDYFGVVVLVLAGAAFGTSPRRSFRWFWVGTGIVSLLWAYGGFTPFFRVVMAIVPGTKYFRAPSTIIYVTAFSVAVLAAIGIERILAKQVSRKYAIGWLIGAAAFALLMTAGGYNVLVNGVGNSMASDLIQTQGYPPEARAQIVDQITQRANTGAAIAGVWRSFFLAAVAAGILFALITDRFKARVAMICLSVLLVIDLWSIERQYWVFSPRASQLFATDGAIEAIRADIAKNGPGRVLNAALNPNVDPLDRFLCLGLCQDVNRGGDILMVHDLRVPGGYHGNELGIYQQLVQLDSGRAQIQPAFWHHENVRYWYTAADSNFMASASTQLHVGPFVRIAGPVKNAAGTTVYAYKMPTDNPAAWVTSAMIKAPQNQALSAILDPGFDQRTVAIFDTTAKDIQAAQIQALPAAATINARVTKYEPGVIDMTLDAPSTAGQALVVSENYFPGWHAIVDGKPSAVGQANYNLIGIALPAGSKNVQLRFTDSSYEKGKAITLVMLLISFAMWIGGAIAERRRRQPVAAVA